MQNSVVMGVSLYLVLAGIVTSCYATDPELQIPSGNTMVSRFTTSVHFQLLTPWSYAVVYDPVDMFLHF